MTELDKIKQKNRIWAQQKTSQDQHYFAGLSDGQSPKILWFGCSDSRVPVSQLSGSQPGDILVQRNIANQVNSNNAIALVEYAINHLQMEHIVVCGHTNCYGIKAACLKAFAGDELDQHMQLSISEIHNLAVDTSAELAHLSTEEQVNKLSEKNVAAQVNKLAQLDVVKKAWSQGRSLSIHGWIYEIHSGLLRDLNICVSE